MSSKGQEDITEDDIQVGGTADVKWRKNNQSATYPAKLEKSRRTKAGVIEYRVHYKNWNKRYDEWVTLDRIMCVYDESGKALKSRIDSSGEDDNGEDDDDDAVEEPPKKKVNLRAKSKGQPIPEPNEASEDKDESDDGKDESESDTVPVTTQPTVYKIGDHFTGAGVLDDLGNSDDEGSDANDENEESSPPSKPVQCAAGCGKDAQVDSIYCSVECILKHAMKVPNKDGAKKGTGSKDGRPSPSSAGPSSSGTPRGDDIPPLETAPPDEPPPEDDSRSDEDFLPDDFEPKPKSKREKKNKKRTVFKTIEVKIKRNKITTSKISKGS